MSDSIREADSGAKLKTLVQDLGKAPRDLTMVFFAAFASLYVLVIAYSLPSLPDLAKFLLVTSSAIFFLILRSVTVHYLAGSLQKKYQFISAVIVHVAADNVKTEADFQVLRLSTLKEIPLDKELKDGMDPNRLKNKLPTDIVKLVEDSKKRIQEGQVKSYYGETFDQRHRILLVSYSNELDFSDKAVIRTRLGPVILTIRRKDMFYIGNYRIPQVFESNHAVNELLVFSVWSYTGVPSQDASLPNTVECRFMVDNYVTHVLREYNKELRALVKSERKFIAELKAAEKSRGELLRHQTEISKLTGKPLMSTIETYMKGLTVSQRSEMKPVTLRDRIFGSIRQFSNELIITFIITIIIGILWVEAPAIAEALGIHS